MAQLETFFYGPHELQKVHVYNARENAQSQRPLWVIYIHGGAWRDSSILADSFSTTQNLLSNHPLIKNHVTAFASIDYRLSPHPDSPQDPSKTPKSRLRDAMHPDHLNDILAAIAFLQERYAFRDQYILVGHSCGAMLSFQAVMNHVPGVSLASRSFPQPRAIAGVCGIYDLRRLHGDFKDIPIYEEIIKGAFGSDEGLWDQVSPGKATYPDGVAAGWQNGQFAVLATSTGDLLINKPQAGAMGEILELWKDLVPGREVIELHDLQEDHDGVWKKGDELASVIVTMVQKLRS